MNANEYNLRELAAGRITPNMITELTRAFQQRSHDVLVADGKLGPKTREVLLHLWTPVLEPLIVDDNGWLVGDKVRRIPADRTWYPITKSHVERAKYAIPGEPNASKNPRAIVWHYTATGTNEAGEKKDPIKPGTALTMANHRVPPLSEDDRVASWHVTIDVDGSLTQMIPFVHGAWHVRQNCPPIPGAGQASLSAVGVEIAGWGTSFTSEQVGAAKRLGRALVTAYSTITPERFGVTHKELDPARRNDPGPVWVEKHAGPVKEYAYGG